MSLTLEDYEFHAERERKRRHMGADSEHHEEDRRSPFEHDRARIIHSVAFRRLQGKTQIFDPHGADFLRSRITHSIEVSQIGRGLAKRFGVPGSLVEAACLGHDLGHPPFGHTGEELLNERMDGHGGFEGNAQTFRIVTRVENKHPNYEGLDLTRATLLALIKYPFKPGGDAEKFLYRDDVDAYAEWLYEGVDAALLDAGSAEPPPRSLPCQLMDWADDIAYSVHDLEDGIACGLLRPGTWNSDHFLEAVHKSLTEAPIRWQAGPPSRELAGELIRPLYDRLAPHEPDIPGDVIRELTRELINDFVVAGTVEQRGAGSTLFDFSFDPGEEVRVRNQVLKSITIEFLLRSERAAASFFKGREILGKLFDALLDSATRPKPRERHRLFSRGMRPLLNSLEGDASAVHRTICDHLAGMTEGQARSLYARLYEPDSDRAF